ncbi:MAG: tripartite tricarboxylate transporter TctB family protein [Pseudomonadota bacterium]
MPSHIPRDVWIGLVMLAGAALYWLGADGIPISPLDGEVNAAAMPKALAYVLAALAVLLIVRAISVEIIAARAGATGPVPQPDPEERAEARRRHLRAAGVIAIGVGYLLVLETLGYLISITLLLIVLAAYIGARRDWRLPATAFALAASFKLIFVHLLGIPLPSGILEAVGL